MKKFLIFMLVLAMASLASATPVLTGPATIGPGDTITITVSGTSDEATDSGTGEPGALSYAIIVDRSDGYAYPRTTYIDAVLSSPSAFTSNVGGSEPPAVAPFIYTDYTSNRIDFTAGSSATWSEATDIDAGTWFTFDLTLDSDTSLATDGTVYIPVDLFIPLSNPSAEVLSVQIVPEPMTIALLGLGGLFLRRRK